MNRPIVIRSAATPPPDQIQRWKPAEHIGQPHLIYSSGTTIQIESQYGIKDALKAAFIICVDTLTGHVYRYDDVNIMPKVLRQTTTDQGVYTGTLEQATGAQSRYYLWADLDETWADWFSQWAAAYLVENADGTISCAYEQPAPTLEAPAPPKPAPAPPLPAPAAAPPPPPPLGPNEHPF